MRYFRRLKGSPAPLGSILEEIEVWSLEFLIRLVYTGLGIVLVLWSWSILATQFSSFPAVDVFSTVFAIITLLLGIRCALSILKGVSGKLAFVVLLWCAFQLYLTYAV